MKTIKNKFSVITLLLSVLFIGISSCVTNDTNSTDNFNDPYGVLPIITPGNTTFDLLNPTSSSIDFSVEPSLTNGTQVSSGEIFANFNDGTYTKVAEINNFPYNYETTLDNIVSLLGLDSANISAGDRVNFKFYFLSNEAVNMTSAEIFSAPILCPPTPGVYTVEMHDAYGDGWQGGGLNVIIDGTTTFLTMLSSWNGGPACCGWTDNTETFTVPNGASTLLIEYVNDDYPSEVTFEIYNPSGDNIGSFGPTPTPGLLDIASSCP